MKYIKYFENNQEHNQEYKVGDYVIMSFEARYPAFEEEILKEFLSKNAGQITKKDHSGIELKVRYLDIPNIISEFFYNNERTFYSKPVRLATKKEIKYFQLQDTIEKFNL